VGSPRTLLFIPTYNERENVANIHGQIRALGLDLDLLFIDDASPDGTGAALEEIARSDPRMRVIHRAAKQGIGTAHLAGIRYAYDTGYTSLISMDCDLTHEPGRIPEFIAAAERSELVVGSRFALRDGVADWNLLRKSLTRIGHFLTTLVLRVPYDATGAFRLYRLDRIDPAVFDLVTSRSYSFFFESMYLLCRTGVHVTEIPMKLPKRTYGHSKMTVRDVLKSVQMLVSLYIRSFRQGDAIVAQGRRQAARRAADELGAGPV
jgi:dolichol-phosphate mannosyltransferase